MAKTEEYLQEFVTGLQSVLEGKLMSAVLYGSAANGDAYTPESDLNVLVVLKGFSLSDLSNLKKVIHRGRKHARIVPVFWTEEELPDEVHQTPSSFRKKPSSKVLTPW
jgi:predicted nucleotidyltransferase